jgi:ABC-type phosphate transport system auxiliary subunit
MNAESGSRALNAAHDLVELLRLAHSAVERLEQEVHGAAFEHADLIAREIQRLRRSAEKLQADADSFVAREESASISRGRPRRRATDLISSAGAPR